MRWLLLHGFGGAPASWSAVSASLSAPAPLVPPLVGHGAALPLGSLHGFDDEVERLFGLLQQSSAADDGARWLLAGYSLGARLALGMLCAHARHFAAAVLIGCHPGLEDEVARHERRAADEAWAARIENRGLGEFADAWQRQALFDTQARLPEEVLAAQRRIRLHHDPASLAWAMRLLSLGGMPARWEDLAGIDVPVTWMAGALDPRFHALAGRAAAKMPRARVQEIPDCGHNPLLEAPSWLALRMNEIAREAWWSR